MITNAQAETVQSADHAARTIIVTMFAKTMASNNALVIPTLPWDDPKRRPALAKHRTHVRRKVLRPLKCSEVPTRLMFRLEHDVPNRARPSAVHANKRELAGTSRRGQERTRTCAGAGRAPGGSTTARTESGSSALGRRRSRLRSRSGWTLRGPRARTSRPISTPALVAAFSTRPSLPGGGAARTFVVRVRIVVRPGHELLVDPREEADGRVREGVAERLRLRRLLRGVPLALPPEPRHAREPSPLGGGVGREEVLQPETRELRDRGRGWDAGRYGGVNVGDGVSAGRAHQAPLVCQALTDEPPYVPASFAAIYSGQCALSAVSTRG